jgi:class 3 adenylate cyclase
MESTGIPDQIQVSEAFRDQLANSFGMDFRGSLEVKGVGMVNTYLLTSGPTLAA